MADPTANPVNQRLLAELRIHAPDAPAVERLDEAPRPDWEVGAHPDVVSWLWETLGIALSPAARVRLYGRPALVAPTSGIAVAVADGTAYALRLTAADRAAIGDETLRQRQQRTWSNGARTDLAATWGPEWIFGAWEESERAWLAHWLDHHESA
jgi:hypothetical protein